MVLRFSFAIVLGLIHAAALSMPVVQSAAEQLLLDQMSMVPRTLVEYCSAAAPESGPALEASLRAFNEKVQAAAAPVLNRLRAQGAFENAGAAKDRGAMDQVKKQMLAEIGKLEPHAYCRKVAMKMRAIDAKAMMDNAERTYLNYLAAAKTVPAPAK